MHHPRRTILAPLLAALALVASAAPAAAQGWGFNGEQLGQSPTDAFHVVSNAYDRPAIGPVDAPITIIEFSDLQCPYCSRGASTIAQLVERYPTDVRVVFRHLPLPFHDRAIPAANAAIAAHKQGAFWPYQDALFAAQGGGLSDSDLSAIAKELGLDMQAFEADRADPSNAAIIKEDMEWAAELGARGTPSFFVNGRWLRGAQPLGAFSAIVDEELARVALLTPEMREGRSISEALTAINVEDQGGIGASALVNAGERPRHPVEVKGGAGSGTDDALLTAVAFVRYNSPHLARLQESLDTLRSVYGEELRLSIRMFPRLLSPIDNWLAGLVLAAGPDMGEAVHSCLVGLASREELGLCVTSSWCEEELETVKSKTTKGLESCGLPAATLASQVNASHAEEALADRRAARYAGGQEGVALFINGRRYEGRIDVEGVLGLADDELAGARRLNTLFERDEIYAAATTGAADTERTYVPVGDRPTLGGGEDAPVTIVALSDFECPYCARGAATLHQVAEKYGDQVRVAFAHLPLAFHQEARPAARAAWAADQQGQFWAFHDALFAGQEELGDEHYRTIAQQLGLDTTRFDKDRASSAAAEAIADDEALAQRTGTTGTPAFFINGRLLSGAQPLEAFSAVIDEELALAKELAPRAKGQYYIFVQRAFAAPDGGDAEGASPYGERAYVSLAELPTRGGGEDAAVTIIEFSDFECPYCAKVQPTLEKLKKEYGDALRFSFVNQPLSFHENAYMAAAVGIAAHEHGRFWEFHDGLFAGQMDLGFELYATLAEANGLPMSTLNDTLDTERTLQRLTADAAIASRLGISGTPTFLINGRELGGAQPYEAFAELIDEELALVASLKKEKKLRGTTPYAELTGGGAIAGASKTRAKLKGVPTKGSKKARHEVALFVDVTAPGAHDALALMQELSAKASEKKVKLLLVPLPREEHNEANDAAAVLLAVKDLDKALAIASTLATPGMPWADPLAHVGGVEGVDEATLRKAVNKGEKKATKTLKKVRERAAELDVLGSPTFVVDGVVVRGTRPLEDFLMWVAS